MFLPTEISSDEFLTRIADGLSHPETVFFFESLGERHAVDTLIELLSQGRQVFAGIETEHGVSRAACPNVLLGVPLLVGTPGVTSYALSQWERSQIEAVVAGTGAIAVSLAA
jgi:hypothetical protein